MTQPLHPELREKFSIEYDENDETLATLTCNKCPEFWDARLPLRTGAFKMLLDHYHYRHEDRSKLREGEIRTGRNRAARLERKLDSVLALVSYLPGLSPVDVVVGRPPRGGELLLQPRDQGGGPGTENSGDDGGQEPVPIDARKATTDDSSENNVVPVHKTPALRANL